MRLIINTASTLKGGGLQVAKSFIEECKKFKEHEFHVILGGNIGQTINKKSFPDNFYFYDIDVRPATKIFSLKPVTSFFQEVEKKVNPDVVFTTSGPAYWTPEAPHLVGFNLGHYIYTDSPFFKIIPFWKQIRWKIRGKLKAHFFKKETDAYVVQTDDVNLRVKKWLKTPHVFTVSNSCSSHYFNPLVFPDKLKDRKKNEYRFLLLSAYHPHKNFEIIRKVIDLEIKDNPDTKMRFVLTLPETIFTGIFQDKYHPYIYNVGPVPVAECASLYKECDAMFLPTLLECFSASYVEAMFMEKPIVTADLGFARTVCEEAAIYFDPLNEKDISNKLHLLMENTELQKQLITKGKERRIIFKTAEERALSYINLCKNLIKQR